MGVHVHRNHELGCEHVMLLLSNVFFFLSFFSLQNELLSLLNIVKQEMGVHD